MSKPTKGFLNDWKPKKPRSTKSTALVSCSTSSSSCVFPFKYMNRYSTVQYNTVQYSTVQYSTVQYSTIQYNTVHVHEQDLHQLHSAGR